MRRLLRMFMTLCVMAMVLVATLWFWPRDRSLTPPGPVPAAALADPAAWLARAEGAHKDIVPGTEKRIHWQGRPGAKTPLSVIYLHGFTASSEEIRPVPDQVAQALNANLFFTRFAGHARGPAAMLEGSADAWIADLAEALAIGGAIGERVLVLATSQGASILTAALGTPDVRAALPGVEQLAGVVMVSPNFRLSSLSRAIASDLPGAGWILPLVLGETIRSPVRNPDHETFWNTTYPTRSALPMAKILRAARAADAGLIDLPLLLLRSPDDKVVSNRATDAVLRGWKGPVSRVDFPLSAGMDPGAHVIAGRIRSPGMTTTVVSQITDWAARTLN